MHSKLTNLQTAKRSPTSVPSHPSTPSCETLAVRGAQAAVPSQRLVSELLSDEAFMDEWVPALQKRLRESWEATAVALDQAGVPYVEPKAAHFCECLQGKGPPPPSPSRPPAHSSNLLPQALSTCARCSFHRTLRARPSSPGVYFTREWA